MRTLCSLHAAASSRYVQAISAPPGISTHEPKWSQRAGSELPDVLGLEPVRSELTYVLFSLDKQYTAEHPAEPWEDYYAQRIIDHFLDGS